MLLGFDRIGSRRSLARNEKIFADGDPADCWYKVISGTVRLCKLLADGRRQVAEFYFSGDCFGLENMAERLFSAEAVSGVIVMRYPRRATEQADRREPGAAARRLPCFLGETAPLNRQSASPEGNVR